MHKLNLSQLSEPIRTTARALLPLLNSTEVSANGIAVTAEIDIKFSELQIKLEENSFHISAPKKVLFSRGLGLALEKYSTNELSPICEKINYDKLEIMADCARNAVLTVQAATRFIHSIALMGYTGLQLYVEDVFEIEDYPYFGYMRGAYTRQELQEIEAQCEMFGIELIPCIQTLAHLGRALKWDCFSDITDFDDILLVDEPKTYILIEAMIKTMSQTLKSRSLNIGMDEAHMLGLGKYLDKHGYCDRVQIMLRHFNKVKQIADKYNYSSMMWSDMFFRLLNEGSYENTVVKNEQCYENLKNQIPQDVELIYWNYYSVDKTIYDTMLNSHLKMSKNIAFAAGAWKWTAPAPYNTYSLHVSQPAHLSCIEHNIRHIIVTSWGDDGGEASIFSVLPTFQFWAEACYGNSVAEPVLAERFFTCTSGKWSDFLLMDEVLVTPENPRYALCGSSPCKYFLYQDVLCGLFDKHVSPLDKPHFEMIAQQLEEASKKNTAWKNIFETQITLLKLLSKKVNCGIELRDAYQSKDKNALKKISQNDLPEILSLIEKFSDAFSRQWLAENKVFGLDMFDIRIGALKQRIQRAITRTAQYLSGELDCLPELEQKILYYDCRDERCENTDLATREYFWSNMATTSSSRNSKSY